MNLYQSIKACNTINWFRLIRFSGMSSASVDRFSRPKSVSWYKWSIISRPKLESFIAQLFPHHTVHTSTPIEHGTVSRKETCLKDIGNGRRPIEQTIQIQQIDEMQSFTNTESTSVVHFNKNLFLCSQCATTPKSHIGYITGYD